MPSPRDHRSDLSPVSTRWPAPALRPHRHHFHDTPPWPHQRYQDYALVEGWGWWPRWYPYWDPQWRSYWWYLYDYYGGDGYPEYAEYARDAVLRSNATQWGLSVGSSYGAPQIGIEPYGVAPVASRSPGSFDQVAAYRMIALKSARKISAATGGLFFGYRDSPWGSELAVFGTRAGLQRWAHEQGADPDVWYAVTFDLSSSPSPLFEVSR